MRPAFLAGVMKSTGNTPPATLAARAPYLVRDLGRLSSYFDVPLQVPSSFPANTLLCMRLVTAVQLAHPGLLLPLTRELWRRHWSVDLDVQTPEGLHEALVAVGFASDAAAALLVQANDVTNKDALKRNTDEAVERGAFGFPALFVQRDGSDEMFFGSDRLSLLAHELGLPWAGPVPGRVG
jgi:glutathione S-transferase kappa 1